MEDEQPLTHPFFATEEENNIVNSAQEEARPCQETDQLVFSTQYLLPLTSMRERRRALLAATPPLPLQATTHQGGRPDLLVCPTLPREGGASDTPEHSNEVENNLRATGTHGHTTHHYVPLLLPLETANVCVLIAPNINFSYPCEDGGVECAHNSDDQLEEGGSECNTITENPTPPTQQFVSGRIVSCNDLNWTFRGLSTTANGKSPLHVWQHTSLGDLSKYSRPP